MILIGSRALAIRSPGLLNRVPKDFDFVCSKAEYEKWMAENQHKVNPTKIYPELNKMIVEGSSNLEFEIQDRESTSLLMELVDKDHIVTSLGKVPTLDLLFTIKSSHKYLKNSPHFWKTCFDYHTMKIAGAKVPSGCQEFLKIREKETYTYKHPKLNQSKKDFFTDDVKYVYDHDMVHRSVALNDKPAYTYYMRDGVEVACDKNKFFSLPRHIQLAGVVEEAAVLAIERSLVPHPGVLTSKKAWLYALSKVCSSITSGWFREFAYENVMDVLKMYPVDYYEKFKRII